MINRPQIKKDRYIILVSLVSKVKTVSATDYLAQERGETAVFAGHYRDYRGKTTS